MDFHSDLASLNKYREEIAESKYAVLCQKSLFGEVGWREYKSIPRVVRSNSRELPKADYVMIREAYNENRGAFAVVSTSDKGMKELILVDAISGSVLERKDLSKYISEKGVLTESILDWKKKTLCPQIWDKPESEDPTLKADVKKEVLSSLSEFLKVINPELESKVKKVFIMGSLTTLQYTEYSDLDVCVIADFTDEELQAVLSKDPSHGGKEIAGHHPLNLYFRLSAVEIPEMLNLYDVNSDEWIRFKPEEGFVIPDQIVQEAISWARKIDLDIGELRRDIQEYRTYTEGLINIDYLDLTKEVLDEKMQTKVDEIKSDIDVLNITYKSLSRNRNAEFKAKDGVDKDKLLKLDTKDPNWSVSNIVYKVLEKFGYIETLHRIFYITRENFDVEKDLNKIISLVR